MRRGLDEPYGKRKYCHSWGECAQMVNGVIPAKAEAQHLNEQTQMRDIISFGLDPDFRRVDENGRSPDCPVPKPCAACPAPLRAKEVWVMSETVSPIVRPFPAMLPIAGVTLRIARSGYKA